MTSTKLRHYFESHKIRVITNFPLRMVLSKPELTGKMAKWAIRLSTYNISYESRSTVKSQALAEFVGDFSPSLMAQAEKEFQLVMTAIDPKPWSFYTDGASNMNGTGLGLFLKSPQGETMAYSVCCIFKATNNEAEYEALILGLTTAKDMKIKCIDAYCNSLLIVNHVNGSYEAKDSKIIAYQNSVKNLQCSFDTFNIRKVPRECNIQADALAGLGAMFKNMNLTYVPVIHFMKLAVERINEESLVKCLDTTVDDNNIWTKAYKDYLLYGIQPSNTNKARALRMKASRFVILDDVLFK